MGSGLPILLSWTMELAGQKPNLGTQSASFTVSWDVPKISHHFSFFLKINLFIYLFLAVLGFHCCAWAFSSCGEQGLLFVAVHGFLIAVSSLVVEHGLQAHKLP